MLLSRVGFPIHLYDDDVVEEVNIAGQFYTLKNIGLSKVNAVKNNIEEYTDSKVVFANAVRVTKETLTNNFVISAFDNMEARKTMFASWESAINDGSIPKDSLFIDGRMEAEVAQVYFVTHDKIERYKETLFDDADVPDLNCSYKSTSHNGAIIGGMITSGFLNHLSNLRSGIVFRSVPFCVEYELPLLNFTKVK